MINLDLSSFFFRYNVADERAYVTDFGYLVTDWGLPIFGVKPIKNTDEQLYWEVK